MSIPVLLLKDTVGKLRRLLEDVFDIVEEDIFPRSLMDATIQDGGTRERRGMVYFSIAESSCRGCMKE